MFSGKEPEMSAISQYSCYMLLGNPNLFCKSKFLYSDDDHCDDDDDDDDDDDHHHHHLIIIIIGGIHLVKYMYVCDHLHQRTWEMDILIAIKKYTPRSLFCFFFSQLVIFFLIQLIVYIYIICSGY